MNGGGLWDEADGFYYDRLRFADGRIVPVRARSMVGLVSLGASLAVPRAHWGRAAGIPGPGRVVRRASRAREGHGPQRHRRNRGRGRPVDAGGHPAAPAPLRDHAERGGVPLALRAALALSLSPRPPVRLVEPESGRQFVLDYEPAESNCPVVAACSRVSVLRKGNRWRILAQFVIGVAFGDWTIVTLSRSRPHLLRSKESYEHDRPPRI